MTQRAENAHDRTLHTEPQAHRLAAQDIQEADVEGKGKLVAP